MYQPKPEDVQFARMVVSTLKDGGKWGAPADQLIYTIDHAHKQLVLENPEQLVDAMSLRTHERGKVVFALVGYDVTETGHAS